LPAHGASPHHILSPFATTGIEVTLILQVAEATTKVTVLKKRTSERPITLLALGFCERDQTEPGGQGRRMR
jgi:hypothetical protein